MSRQKWFLIIIISVCFTLLGFFGAKLINNNSDHHVVVEDENKGKAREKEVTAYNKKHDNVKKDIVKLTSDVNNNKTASLHEDINFNADSLLQELLDELSIDMEDVEDGLKQFKENEICIEWEVRINRKIGDKLSEEQKRLMRENHLIALYVKDQVDLNYLENPEITHEEYKENLALAFKWHQETYQEILSDEEYEQLFEVSVDETDDIIDSMINAAPEIEITNREFTIDDVYEIVPAEKIEELAKLFKERQLGARSISNAVDAGEISAEEAGEIWNGYYQDYIYGAEDLLDAKEFEIIFGYAKKN